VGNLFPLFGIHETFFPTLSLHIHQGGCDRLGLSKLAETVINLIASGEPSTDCGTTEARSSELSHTRVIPYLNLIELPLGPKIALSGW
jgi:hypothetical protein